MSASLHGWHSLWRCYKCCSHPGAHVTGSGLPPSQFSWLWYLNIPMDCKKLKLTWKMDSWDLEPFSMSLSTFLNAMQIQSEIKVLPILIWVSEYPFRYRLRGLKIDIILIIFWTLRWHLVNTRVWVLFTNFVSKILRKIASQICKRPGRKNIKI